MITDEIKSIITAMWANGQTSETIKAALLAKGIDETLADEAIEAFKKEHHAKQLHKGFVFMGIGAFLGFISCVLSILNPFPEFYNLILYGLTSFSIVVAFYGLYCVFE